MRFKSLRCLFPLLLCLTQVEKAAAQKNPPVAAGGNFILTAGSGALTTGPGRGARIRSLKYANTELLYVDSSGGNNDWGSTFWPSPQAYWTTACKTANPPNADCWPPPANLDPNAYTGGIVATDTTVFFAGAADAAATGTHLRFGKTFWANSGDSSFNNHYTMVNTFTSAVSFAPWEITRFPGGGLTFYPVGQDTLRGTAALRAMTRDSLGVRWFTYDSSMIPAAGTPKIYGDGSLGWYAHVDKNRVLFVKNFKDTPFAKNAPYNTSESECELYTANAKTYQEMELQGSFDTIPAGDSVSWDVKWLVRKLPDSIAIGSNSALLNFVNQVVNSSATPVWNPSRVEFHALSYSAGHVTFDLERTSSIALALVNSSGREISRIHSGLLTEGHHEFLLEPAPPRGIYWLVLKNQETARVSSVKILVLF